MLQQYLLISLVNMEQALVQIRVILIGVFENGTSSRFVKGQCVGVSGIEISLKS